MYTVKNITTQLNSIDGKPYKDQTGKDLTARYFMVEALGSAKGLTGEEKITAYALGMKIQEHDEVELSEEQKTLLHKTIEDKDYPADIHAQVLACITSEQSE